MAWTAPVNTFASGNVLTAAQMNAIGDNLWAGGPVYATEADRTTAIPSPFEGQRAYITGSTETTAAGVATFIPTGIQTIYNGTGWVTITPVSANTDTTGTTTSTSYTTTLTSGGTNPSVTLRTGSAVLVSVLSQVQGSANSGYRLSATVTSTPTVAASDRAIAQTVNTGTDYLLSSTYVMAVTAGLNTFQLAYLAGSGTGTYRNRFITVQGIA